MPGHRPAPRIRKATADDLPAVGRVLAAAFADDPLWMWMSKHSPAWSRRAERWFAAEARLKLDGHGEVLVDDEVGAAAIWTEPEHWRGSWGDSARVAVPSAALFRARLLRTLGAVNQMERAHPTTPHWYLEIIGTDPAHQGRGLGGALIETVTARCDEQGLGAFLESSKAENVPYYERFGFEMRRELPLKRGPSMWLMWRDPR